MGSFKKGRWVRVIDNEGAPRLYTVGEVCQVESIKGTVTCVGKNAGMYSWRFEAWTPKVGDRVRLVKDGRSTTGAIGKTATISSWTGGVLVDTGEYLLDIDPPVDYKTAAVTENFTRATIDCFEPLPAAPTPLTITAGRYYKTRDGRKVGPMEACYGGFADSARRVTSQVWESDGSFIKGFPSQLDLVALWEEPAVAVAASNDNAEAAPAKFKVGDRIGAKAWGETYRVVRIDGGKVTIASNAYEETEYTYDVDEFDWVVDVFPKPAPPAIVALIEAGVAKPSSKPKVHPSAYEATKEAERLALEHPGQEFGVFVLADSKIADVVEEVVKKTVLRAA